MKKLFTLASLWLIYSETSAQQNYCDFEGTKVVYFGQYTGILDSNASNPAIGLLNLSSKCGRYIRDTNQYDNLKIFPMSKLVDVTPYASATGSKITMKVYSTGPAGSKVELQLGSKFQQSYPAGVHSQYTATIASSKTWELITFNYLLSPSGSSVAATDIDKVVILYRPNSHNHDTLYFDDLTGPDIAPVGIMDRRVEANSLRAVPNPASSEIILNYEVNSGSESNTVISDLLGHVVYAHSAGNLSGSQRETINASGFSPGIYFCRVSQAGHTSTVKVVISH